jgi:hypothetical protein
MFNRFKPAKTPSGHWHAGLVLLCVTCLLLVATGRVASSEYEFRQTASHAKGVVIRQNAGKHHVEITFTTAAGESLQYSQNGHISYEVGDEVTVLYDPKEPGQNAETDAIGAVWANTIGLSIFSAFAFVFSMLTIFFPKYIYIRGPGIKIDMEK